MATDEEVREQPIWVQDLLAWLEKIKGQDAENFAERVKELLAELPGQGLPKEYWVKAKAGDDDDAKNEIELQVLSDEDRDKLRQELENVYQIESDYSRSPALAAVVAKIPPSEPQLLQVALDAAKAIKDEQFRWQPLVAVAAQLPPSERQSVLQAAFDAAKAIESELGRLAALANVAAHLPSSERQSMLQEALDAAKAIESESYRPSVLAAVAAKIPPSEPQLLQEALDAAKAIKNELYRWQTLAAIAVQLAASEPQLLQAALDAAKAIESDYYRSQALADVVAQLPASECQSVLEAALDATKAIKTEYYRSKILAAVVAKIPPSEPQLLQVALDTAKAIKDEQYRSPALAAVAAKIPPSEPQLLQEALDTAKAIKDEQYRSPALAAVAAQLPPSERQSVLQAVLDAAKSIEDEQYRSRVLAAVAAQLPPSERQSVLQAALDAAKATIHEEYRSWALADVAAQLPPSERQLLQAVLDAARAICEGYRSEALAAVAARLPPSERQSVLQAALDAAKSNWDAEYQSRVLAAVAAQIPASEPQLLQEALDAAKSIWDEYYRSRVLAAVAAQIPPSEPQLLQAALDAAFKIEDKNSRINSLSDIAFHSTEFLLLQSSPSQISTILEIVPKGKTSADKAKLLSALAPHLSIGLFPRAFQLIKEINHPDYQADVVGNLAPYVSTNQLSELLVLVENHIVGFSYLTKALCNLIPRLSLPQIQQALTIARRIKCDNLLAQILRTFATRMNSFTDNRANLNKQKQPLKNRLIQHILKRTVKLTAEKDIAAIILNLSPSLNNADDSAIILEKILPKVKSKTYHARILAAIAPSLSSVKLQELLQSIDEVIYKVTAISTFISSHPENESQNIALNLIFLSNLDQLHRQIEKTNDIKLAIEVAITLATHAHPQILTDRNQSANIQNNTLRMIREQSRDYDKANYLIQIAPHLISSQAIEAQNIAQDIQDIYHKARSLVALANHFPQSRYEALQQIKQVKDEVQQIELLCQFATIVPEEIPNLLKNIEMQEWAKQESFDSESVSTDPNRYKYKRTLILKALKPHLPIRLSREIDRETRIGEAPQDLWKRSLFVLRNEYRQALKSGSFRNDAAQDEDLLDLKDEINALTEMLLMRDLTPPVAVGILGGWGGGKSYMMHLMQKHMVDIRSRGLDPVEAWGFKDNDEKNPDSNRLNRYVGHIYQIKFDAWTYAKSDLWASLMQTIFFELDRQISLETALRDIGIAPLDKEGNKIWEVLYKTNEEDRKYFLEKALGKDNLKELQAKSEEEKESWTELLWEQYGVQETNAKIDLSNKQNELKIVVSKLNELKEQKKSIKNEISDDHKPENWIAEILTETTNISGFLLKRFFDENVAADLEKEINNKLKAENVDISDLNKMNAFINKTVSEILDEDQIKLDNGSKKYSLSWLALKKWLKKNQQLIIAFIILITCSIIFPFIAHHINSQNVVSQIAALVAPLIPAIGLAQTLYKSNQKWFNQAEKSVREYQETLKTRSESKYHNLVDERNTNQLRDIENEVDKLVKQQKSLEQAVEKAKNDLPPDKFTSLANFVSATVGEASYDKKLGIMHQVKEHLTKLSQALLPPPSDSEEYKTKLVQLQNVFPRGPARVVLYIDDLDRCPPKTVVEVLEAVQLLVKNPLFIAVLAIDERYITRALADHYKGVLPLKGRPSASDYLEKIIQIPYRVRPIAENALRQYLRAQIVVQDSETSGTKFNEFSPEEFNLLVTCCQEAELSPRSLKRLTNVYKLYKVLSRTHGQKPTPKEQKTILTLLTFSSRYPDLMRDILQKIGSFFEQSQNVDNEKETLFNVFKTYLENPAKNAENSYLAEDVKQLAYDVEKLVDKKLELNEIRSIFDFVRTFSFVGDIGVDHT